MIRFSLETLVAGGLTVGAIVLSAAPVAAMHKQDLIITMAKDAGISKSEASKALDSFTANTAKALKKSDRVSHVGFGSFSASNRAARS